MMRQSPRRVRVVQRAGRRLMRAPSRCVTLLPIPSYCGGYAQTIRGSDDADYYSGAKTFLIATEGCATTLRTKKFRAEAVASDSKTWVTTTQEDSMSDMMTRIVVAAALVAGSATFVSAQDFDPNGANRGYPQYAAPGSVRYYGGQLQGSRAGSPLRSVQVGLHRNVTAVRRPVPRRPVAPPAALEPGEVTPLE
jgi:hypothetical protein